MVYSCSTSDNEEKSINTEKSVEQINLEIEKFIGDWNNALNNKDISSLSQFYSDSIDYYGKKISKNQVISSKLKYFEKHPDFRQVLTGDIKIDQMTNGLFRCSFRKKMDYLADKNTYDGYLIIEKNDSIFKIVNESDLITDENSGNDDNIDNSNFLIQGLKKSIIYSENLFDDRNLVKYYSINNWNGKLKPKFMIRFESQLIVTIRATAINKNSYTVPLMNFDSYLIDTPGDFVDKCYLQVGQHDFDKDGNPEFIFAYGSKGEYLKLFILKYFEPSTSSDVAREENWKIIGEFDYGYYDPRYLAHIEDNKIYVPVGSQGYSEGHLYVDSKFVKFQ